MRWVQAGACLLLRVVQQGSASHLDGSKGRCWRPGSRVGESIGSFHRMECLKTRDCVWCKKLLNEIPMHKGASLKGMQVLSTIDSLLPRVSCTYMPGKHRLALRAERFAVLQRAQRLQLYCTL